ncbi:GIY-YIG nuclease family protein [Streptomyces sp. NBC_00525]|uniref:GIY-YIG nuclease family protein n=1 Tax=Streptomyces sp. NBC_00525 TaxID=2903660 RepID=UPI002E8074F8|nr:GIY-YIG nuclease family protein [Streptomyces sp. NBC_00525]WUC94367.1 GIY-YIG nuclease family protein [Streptomyces sp. NBC_00525]
MKHVICKADINRDIYIEQKKAEKEEGKPRELLVFGACSNQGCTRRAVWEPMGPLVMKLCREHVYQLSGYTKKKEKDFIKGMDDEGLITKHTKGWTYVIRMKGGVVKIGTSVALNKRLQTLSRDQGGVPVVVLAVLPGGVSREALEHKRWESYRISGTEELFHPAAQILDWAKEQGVSEGAVDEVEKFNNWTPKDDHADYWLNWGRAMTEQKQTEEGEKAIGTGGQQ